MQQQLQVERLRTGGLNFLHELWGHQPDGFFCISFRRIDSDGFGDVWYKKRKGKFERTRGVLPMDCPFDMYFAPVAFSTMERTKKAVLPSRWLFADLDWVPPHEVPFPPTFAWETSVGKWQAVWMVHGEMLEPEDLDSLNKAMTRACGADPGTWNRNRLLRVPGTDNYKKLREELKAKSEKRAKAGA